MMNIESPSPGSQINTSTNITVLNNDSIKEVEHDAPSSFKNQNAVQLDTKTKIKLDEATGLMQNITTDAMTEEVLRKIPSDEYLHLLSLLDDIISGSIDKEI